MKVSGRSGSGSSKFLTYANLLPAIFCVRGVWWHEEGVSDEARGQGPGIRRKPGRARAARHMRLDRCWYQRLVGARRAQAFPYLAFCDSGRGPSPEPSHGASHSSTLVPSPSHSALYPNHHHRLTAARQPPPTPTTTATPSIALPTRISTPATPTSNMSSNTSGSTYPEFFRRRTLGRAPSPPTWACYEQIPYADDYSDSGSDVNSCSEDEDDYHNAASDAELPVSPADGRTAQPVDGDMEIDEDDEAMSAEKVAEMKKDVKGKQRAVEQYESPKREPRKKPRQPVFTLRPILTIQKSQGFVWNQVSTCT